MENEKKLIFVLITATLLVPLVTLLLSLEMGFFSLMTLVLLLLMFIMLPFVALGVYMWVTGKGQWAISGYNMMSKKEQSYYDAERMARDAGKIAVITCLACLIGTCAMLYLQQGMLIFLMAMGVVVLSVVFYGGGRRYLKDQTRTPPPPTNKERRTKKAIVWVTLGVTAAILVIVVIFIGSGSVNATMDGGELHVNAPFVNENISFDNIISVELREDMDLGSRMGGFGGTKVLSGNFNNKEFGDYTLACYKDIRTYIVVERGGGKMLVFNKDSVADTAAFFEDLLEELDARS